MRPTFLAVRLGRLHPRHHGDRRSPYPPSARAGRGYRPHPSGPPRPWNRPRPSGPSLLEARRDPARHGRPLPRAGLVLPADQLRPAGRSRPSHRRARNALRTGGTGGAFRRAIGYDRLALVLAALQRHDTGRGLVGQLEHEPAALVGLDRDIAVHLHDGAGLPHRTGQAQVARLDAGVVDHDRLGRRLRRLTRGAAGGRLGGGRRGHARIGGRLLRGGRSRETKQDRQDEGCAHALPERMPRRSGGGADIGVSPRAWSIAKSVVLPARVEVSAHSTVTDLARLRG